MRKCIMALPLAMLLVTGCIDNGVIEETDEFRLIILEAEDRQFECLAWDEGRRAAMSCEEIEK